MSAPALSVVARGNPSAGVTLKRSHLVLLYAKTRIPPSEFLLFPFGKISTLKGDFYLTAEGAQEIIARFEGHGVDLMVDYNHRALDEQATEDEQKAAGWADLELREDGIWMTSIRWLDRAAEYLRNGEYRYLSPAFNADKKTNEILELVNVAMTNLPATNHQRPLVQASRTEEVPMANIARKLKAHMSKSGMSHSELGRKAGISTSRMRELSGGADATEDEMSRCSKAMGGSKKMSVVGDVSDLTNGVEGGEMAEDEDEDTENPGTTEISKEDMVSQPSQEARIPGGSQNADENRGDNTVPTSRAKSASAILSALGVDSPGAALVKINRLLEKAEKADDNEEAIVQLRDEMTARERREIMTALKRDDKLEPNVEKFCAQLSLEQLRAWAKVAPKVAGGTGLQEPGQPANVAGVTLSREDIEVNRFMGTDPKAFAEHKKMLGAQVDGGRMGLEEGREATDADRLTHEAYVGRADWKSSRISFKNAPVSANK